MHEGMLDEFEKANDEGKLEMYEEALSNIDQLSEFIRGHEAEILQLRQALADKDKEIAMLQARELKRAV